MLALATLPLLLSLAVLFAGPIALPRYMVPMIQGSVLMVGLMLTPVRWLPIDRAPDEARPGEEDNDGDGDGDGDDDDATPEREPVPATTPSAAG